MRPRILVLTALLAGACLSAGYPATRLGPDNAVDMRFPRASSRSIVVQTEQPAYASFIEVSPGRDTVAEWVDSAAPRELSPGRHMVALEGADAPARRRGREWGVCNRPGEQPFFDPAIANTVAAPADIRLVRTRGRWIYCARPGGASSAETREARHVLVVVAPRAARVDALQGAVDAFNEQYGGSPQYGEALARSLTQTIAGRWPGSTAYYLRLPTPQ